MAGFWDLFGGNKVEIKQVIRPNITQKGAIDENIFKEQIVRVRQDAGTWRKALKNAENPQNPIRDDLYTIYQDVTLDLHLQSVINQRSKSVSSLGFKIVNDDNTEDETATAFFKTSWFNLYQKHILSTPYFGFTVIQLNDVFNNKFVGVNETPGVRLIDHRLYFPEEQIIRFSPQSFDGHHWHDDEFRGKVIAEGDPEDLGVLNGISPLTLMKKSLVQFWADYAELFGQPTRVLHTSTKDPRERKRLETTMEDMGSLNYVILKMNDTLELMSSRQEDAHEVYHEFLKYVDSGNSKVILGQTMTTDDGSSLSQADVHERTREMFTLDDKNLLLYNVNDKLIPRMIDLGFKIKHDSFRIDDKEVLSLMDQFKIDLDLLNSKQFSFDADYFKSKYGTELKNIDPSKLDAGGLKKLQNILQIYR